MREINDQYREVAPPTAPLRSKRKSRRAGAGGLSLCVCALFAALLYLTSPSGGRAEALPEPSAETPETTAVPESGQAAEEQNPSAPEETQEERVPELLPAIESLLNLGTQDASETAESQAPETDAGTQASQDTGSSQTAGETQTQASQTAAETQTQASQTAAETQTQASQTAAETQVSRTSAETQASQNESVPESQSGWTLQTESETLSGLLTGIDGSDLTQGSKTVSESGASEGSGTVSNQTVGNTDTAARTDTGAGADDGSGNTAGTKADRSDAGTSAGTAASESYDGTGGNYDADDGSGNAVNNAALANDAGQDADNGDDYITGELAGP
ncbi:MAG: hypothetical protein K6E83_00695 [Clostridium sp.]|nr:hypothetical protein [Clostridium sp.]